jgi:hypothetical protein
MFKGIKIVQFVKLLVEVCGGWWSAMSGAISIPLAFVALLTNWHPKLYFAVLAFVGLFYTTIRLAWKNYQLLAIEKPARNRALLIKITDDIRGRREARTGDFVKDYCRDMQPPNPIGALVKFSDEIQTEADLQWLCAELVKSRYESPFERFESVLGNSQMWLPILREARSNLTKITDEAQFLQFLALNWTGKEKWKQGQERLVANKPVN